MAGLVDLISQFDPSTTASNQTRNTNDMGKDQFLQLLVTQLKNQDPLDPMKNEQFVAQLAQFNSLEQMINLNKSFESMMALQQMSYASTFIGKHVTWMDPNGTEQGGTVSEVYVSSGQPMLNVGDGVSIKPEDVVAISNPQQ